MRADIYNITIFNEYFNNVTKRMFKGVKSNINN